jgi:hypothetical protein
MVLSSIKYKISLVGPYARLVRARGVGGMGDPLAFLRIANSWQNSGLARNCKLKSPSLPAAKVSRTEKKTSVKITVVAGISAKLIDKVLLFIFLDLKC